MNWKFWKPQLTKEQIEQEIREIYERAPYHGRWGLLVSDGSSQRYWELQSMLEKFKN